MLFLCLIYFSLLNPVFTSIGDSSYVFRTCVSDCSNDLCAATQGAPLIRQYDAIYRLRFGKLESLVLWNCDRECRYRCMWRTVDAFKLDGRPVPQFFGKWPFVRIVGVQEPSSALFSSMNLIFQLYCLLQLFKLASPKLAIHKYWMMQYVFSINAWLWSTVFHTIDTPLTEKLDYFSALAFIFYSLVMLQQKLFPTQPYLNSTVAICLCAFFVRHICYMSLQKFDYGYNMVVAVTIGLIHCTGWLFWSVFLCPEQCQSYVFHCRLSIIYLLLFMSLELLDFPPLGWMLDAHSLWHASSLLIAFHWYKFVLADCRNPSSKFDA